MAKSAAERKAAQRARLAEAGNRKMELQLDEQEMEMLARNCAARRPGRAPPVALVVRRMTWLSTSRCLFGRMMPGCVGVSSQSVRTGVVSVAIRFQSIHARAMVIRHVG